MKRSWRKECVPGCNPASGFQGLFRKPRDSEVPHSLPVAQRHVPMQPLPCALVHQINVTAHSPELPQVRLAV